MSTLLDQIKSRMDDLQRKISLMTGVGTPEGNGRGLMPGFRLTDDIKDMLQQIPPLVVEDHLDMAISQIQETEGAFNGKRVVWLRNSLGRLEQDYVISLGLNPDIKPTWLQPLREKFREFQSLLLGGERIDGDQAAERLREIIEMSYAVEAKGIEESAQKERQRLERDRKNLEKHREHCRDTADHIKNSLLAMFASA